MHFQISLKRNNARLKLNNFFMQTRARSTCTKQSGARLHLNQLNTKHI
jgi:hypothetical protein